MFSGDQPMNHEHRSKYRTQDQFVCPACGKSWDVDDNDVPECVSEQTLGMRERAARKGTHRQTQAMFRRRV